MSWFLVYTLKKFTLLCPLPIASFFRSGDPLLNILGGRGVNLGTNCVGQYRFHGLFLTLNPFSFLNFSLFSY